MAHPDYGSRPDDSGSESASRPAWLNARLIPQTAVIGSLVLAVAGYIPAGRPIELAGGLTPGLHSSERRITIIVNGESREVSTQAQTVSDLMKELGYEGRATASVPDETRLDQLNGPLSIEAAREIHIVAGSQAFTIFARSDTVGDLLRKIGLELNAERSRAEGVHPGTPLRDGMTVYVKKLVLPLTVTEEEQLPYGTEKVVDPSLPAGSRKVIRTGRVGQRVKTYRVEAGLRGSLHRVLVHTDVTVQPVAERIAVGIQPPEDGGPVFPTISPTLPVAGATGPNSSTDDRSAFTGWNLTPVVPAPGEPLFPRNPSTDYPLLPTTRPQPTGPAPSAPTPPWVTSPTSPVPTTPVPTTPEATPSEPAPKPTPTPTEPSLPTGPATSSPTPSDAQPFSPEATAPPSAPAAPASEHEATSGGTPPSP